MTCRSRSLFTLEWSGGGGSDAAKSSSGARLLSSIEDFLDNAISEEDSDEVDSPWNKTLSLVPPTVTTLSSIPLPSTTTAAAAKRGDNNSSAAALPSCPMIPPGLRGPIKVTLPAEVPPSMEEVESRFPNLLPGGRSRPRDVPNSEEDILVFSHRIKLP